MNLPKKAGTGVTTKGAFTRAVERFRKQREAGKDPVRIGFIIDATGSREDTWEQAQTIQGRMFQSVAGLGKVSLRLVHFGGNEITDHGWADDTRALAARMAGVRCRSGRTLFARALCDFSEGSHGGEPANAVILVGDAFEDKLLEVEICAAALGRKGIRVFTFLEGDDADASHAFKRIAALSGGRFARLGDDLPLGDLCEGVVLLAAGGEKAVRRLKNEKARKLLLAGPPAK